MNYNLNNISESFMNKIQKVKEQKQNDPFSRLKADLADDLSGIVFSCTDLGRFLQERLNHGRQIRLSEADKMEFPLGGQIFIDFEKEFGIRTKYSFNELRYFHNVKFVPMESASDHPDFLEELTVPDTWTKIPDKIFSLGGGLDAVKKIRYSPKIVSFGKSCFEESNCETLYIPETTVEFGSRAFNSTVIRTEKLIIPNGITEIPEICFTSEGDDDAIAFKELILPNSLMSIGASAFAGTGIKQLALPASLMKIGNYAFSNCKNLGMIAIPSNLKKISMGCFRYCSSLKRVVIPNGVTEISESAFAADEQLEEIELPASVRKVGKNAFSGCTNFIKLILHSVIDFDDEDFFEQYSDENLNSLEADVWDNDDLAKEEYDEKEEEEKEHLNFDVYLDKGLVYPENSVIMKTPGNIFYI